MTAFHWLIFILIVQLIHFFGTFKLYERAQKKWWQAAIPVYNAIILMKIIRRPTWWTILLFIPIINLIIFPVIWISTLKVFGKTTILDKILVVVTFGFYIYFINFSPEETYHPDSNCNLKNKTENTLSSLLFAIIVATLVHTYVIQPYTIPTSSLEKSLLIGDFLFVSKMNYGARTPISTISLPMVHDTIPILKIKSYLSYPQLPYFRLPGIENVKRNDIVVFNWPTDTLYNMYLPADKKYYKPIDKRTNYVKRCVGIPGDTLEIKDGIIYINGNISELPERAKPQYSYKVSYDGKTPLDFEHLLRDLEITDYVTFVNEQRDTLLFSALTVEATKKLKNIPGITSIQRNIYKGPEDGIFPDFKDGKVSLTNNWNLDNFGPIYIPQKGQTINLNKKILPLYKSIITEYENNKLYTRGNDIYINDVKTRNYTFKQNYYWMMGDNRHNSLDARYFGYTPEDHIVGKPVFIWMSWNTSGKGIDKIRWDRIFTTVSGDGKPQSYFKHFLFLLLFYFIIDRIIKKRKKI